MLNGIAEKKIEYETDEEMRIRLLQENIKKATMDLRSVLNHHYFCIKRLEQRIEELEDRALFPPRNDSWV